MILYLHNMYISKVGIILQKYKKQCIVIVTHV